VSSVAGKKGEFKKIEQDVGGIRKHKSKKKGRRVRTPHKKQQLLVKEDKTSEQVARRWGLKQGKEGL